MVHGVQIDFSMRHLAGLLGRYRYRFATEFDLHDGIAQVLLESGIAFRREHVFDPRNRADFFFEQTGIVVEVKIDGTLSAALRQVDRYCHLEPVNGVLLASSKLWAAQPLPAKPHMAGKSFSMIHVRRQSL